MRKSYISCVALLVAILVACQNARSADRVLHRDDIQRLGDVTAGFHSPEQRSTVNSITNIPYGVELDVTFRIGNGDCDPLFGCGAGQPFADFARVSTSAFFNNDPVRVDYAAFDGFTLNVESSVADVFVQPLLQTAPNWTFYEQSDGGDTIPANTPTAVGLDFNDAQNFSGLNPPNEVHPDGNGEILANGIGYQFLYQGPLVYGDADVEGVTAVSAIIRLTGVVPEPSTMLLALLATTTISLTRRRV